MTMEAVAVVASGALSGKARGNLWGCGKHPLCRTEW
jgi:hypothetical protein